MFFLGTVELILVLANSAWIMMKSSRAAVNIWEWLCLRAGFSIYTGWLTAAIILSVTTVLQRAGVSDETLPFGNEQQWAVAVLWTALIIYNVGQYVERNPLFGAVFMWVLFAMGKEQVDYPLITFNTDLLMWI